MAKKAARRARGFGMTRKQARTKTHMVNEGITPQNRAAALFELRRLRVRFYDLADKIAKASPPELVPQVKAALAGTRGPMNSSEWPESVQKDLREFHRVGELVKQLAAAVGVKEDLDLPTAETLILIGEILDGGHRHQEQR